MQYTDSNAYACTYLYQYQFNNSLIEPNDAYIQNYVGTNDTDMWNLVLLRLPVCQSNWRARLLFKCTKPYKCKAKYRHIAFHNRTVYIYHSSKFSRYVIHYIHNNLLIGVIVVPNVTNACFFLQFQYTSKFGKFVH